MNIHANPAPTFKRVALVAASALAALAILPAAGQATTTFGTNVTPDLQPSNAGDGHLCSEITGQPGNCTWVEYEAYSNGGPLQTVAPKSGKLRKVRWVAQSPGSFRLVLVNVKQDGELGRITYRSQKINYEGQPENQDPTTYAIESAKIGTEVKKGQYLGIQASSTSMLRCSSGGPNTLIFQPPLQVGDPFAPVTADDGCWMTLQGVIK